MSIEISPLAASSLSSGSQSFPLSLPGVGALEIASQGPEQPGEQDPVLQAAASGSGNS